MDLSFTSEQIGFRDQVSAFLSTAMPPDIARKAAVMAPFEHEEVMAWHRILYQKGWVAPHWPKEYGGTGWDITEQFIFSEECIRLGAPALPSFALSMIGPLLIECGTAAQKRRFLPKMLSGEEVWCQGYSEPGAGSDLAALTTRAQRQGDYFIVNGQKTWTSEAQHADWIFCLVRTDPTAKKQSGISFLLIDIKHTKGVQIRPFLTLGGRPSFSETFFEDAEVPVTNLVGPLHGGWTVAKALLGYERVSISGVNETARALRLLDHLSKGGTAIGTAGARLVDDPVFRYKLTTLRVQHQAIRMALLRTLAATQRGKAPGPESSILKLRGTEILQKTYDLLMEALGYDALNWFNPEGAVPPEHAWIPSLHCYLRAASIYGGSNEIQRNIIAKQILGLPT